MDTLADVFVFIHLVGFAALFGGAFVQLRDEVKVVNAAMLHGVLTQVVSGLVLVGVLEGMDTAVDNPKLAVKLAVALVIAVLCWVNRAKEQVPHGLFYGVMLLTLGNVGVAVFW
ncbi:MAG: hypothetical protein ACRDQA_06450 [Nocardioidaceae bacterium]